MAYRKSNGHVIEIQDGGLAQVCTLRLLFLVFGVFDINTGTLNVGLFLELVELSVLFQSTVSIGQ